MTTDTRFATEVDTILDRNGGDIGAAISQAASSARTREAEHEAHMRYLLTGEQS